MDSVYIDDKKLGRFLLRKHKISQEVLEKALIIQQDLPFLRLGEILLGLRVITFSDLLEALYSQFSDIVLGDILIKRQLITQEQLREALEIQNSEVVPRRLGAILVALGRVTESQIEDALSEKAAYQEYRAKISLQYLLDQFPSPLQNEAFDTGVEGLPFDESGSLLGG